MSPLRRFLSTFLPPLAVSLLLPGVAARAQEAPPRSADHVIINAHPQPEYGPAIPFRKVSGTGGTLALDIVGDRLYALENNGLSIYDITYPKSPQKLGHIGGMGNVRQLQVRGKTAFLTARQCGLWAVDVSDDHHPRIISNFDAVEMATGLDVAGDVAFIGNRVYGVQCVDVSDPARMKHLSSLRTDESQSTYYGKGLLFSGDWSSGEVTVIDVSDLLQPKPLSLIQLDGYGDGMAIRDGLLFASTGQHKKSGPEDARHGAGHGLDIFDISDPAKPVKLAKVTFPTYYLAPCDYWTPRLSGDHCFASDTTNGLFVLDISDPRNPRITGNLVLPKSDPENPEVRVPFAQIMDPAIPQGDPISSIAVGDGVLYMSGNFTGIYLAEFPGIAQPESRDFGELPKLPARPYPGIEEGFLSSGPELTNPTRGVALHGDIAYTANLWDGVKIHRLEEDKISLMGHVGIPYAADIKRSGDRLYVAEGANGIGVYRIQSPTRIEEIGRLPELKGQGFTFVQYLWAFEGKDTIAASCAGTRIDFIDFSDPAHPEVVFGKSGNQLLYGSYAAQKLAKGRYFGLSRHVGGLMVFDLAEKKPKDIWYDGFPLCSHTGGVAAVGDELFVNRASGYAFFDPEQPVATRELPIAKFPGQTELYPDAPDDSPISKAMFPKNEWEGLPDYDAATGRLAVMNRIFRNLRIYDFSDKASPTLLKHLDLNSHPYAPTFWKGRVVLPGGYSGLLLEKGEP